MTEKKQIWKCEICGNIIEVLHEGADSLVCCNQPMNLQQENYSENEGQEKHIPIIEKVEGGVDIKVGEVKHPMEEDHYIEWIEIILDNNSIRKFLKPEEKSKGFFPIDLDPKHLKARAYCNVHGLWKSKANKQS